MIRLAFECFADRDLVRFLKTQGLSAHEIHGFSQGEVINAVLRGSADVGIVDEDPNRSHHRGRDAMRVVESTTDVDVLEMADAARRRVLVLKPDLEGCFFAGLGRTKLSSVLAQRPEDLHRKLGQPKAGVHAAFQAELGKLHAAAVSRRCECFTRDLVRLLI